MLDVCPASLALSGSLWLSLALSGSLWLSLAPSGSLRLSLALYCSPNLLTKPLLGSQGPCSARNAVPVFPHFNQPWCDSSLAHRPHHLLQNLDSAKLVPGNTGTTVPKKSGNDARVAQLSSDHLVEVLT